MKHKSQIKSQATKRNEEWDKERERDGKLLKWVEDVSTREKYAVAIHKAIGRIQLREYNPVEIVYSIRVFHGKLSSQLFRNMLHVYSKFWVVLLLLLLLFGKVCAHRFFYLIIIIVIDFFSLCSHIAIITFNFSHSLSLSLVVRFLTSEHRHPWTLYGYGYGYGCAMLGFADSFI